MNGNGTPKLSGILYFPNADVTFNGSSHTANSNDCLELVAKTVTISGNANMASSCSSLGAASFTSLPPVVSLVQ